MKGQEKRETSVNEGEGQYGQIGREEGRGGRRREGGREKRGIAVGCGNIGTGGALKGE